MRANAESQRGKAVKVAIGILLLFATPLAAIGQMKPEERPKHSDTVASQDYRIGPADVLTVTIADAPEYGGRFRVSDSGFIEIPGALEPIHAEGQSTIELAHSIREALVTAKQLRDPHVSVLVDEYRGSTVTVLGAVGKPAVYPLTKRTNVLEALSLAGGTLPNNGNTVTVVRGAASAEATNSTLGSVQILRMSDLVSGKDLAGNVEVRNGDIINVSGAQVIYVVGAVVKPGGFAMADPNSGVSVVQAIALAEGLKGVASGHCLIVRQSTNEGSRTEVPVDIQQMMSGKTADMVLAPNDILFVPTSRAKQSLKVMGEVALAAVNGIAIYGVGYRVAGVTP